MLHSIIACFWYMVQAFLPSVIDPLNAIKRRSRHELREVEVKIWERCEYDGECRGDEHQWDHIGEFRGRGGWRVSSGGVSMLMSSAKKKKAFWREFERGWERLRVGKEGESMKSGRHLFLHGWASNEMKSGRHLFLHGGNLVGALYYWTAKKLRKSFT